MYLCPKQEATAVHLSVKEHRLSTGGLLVRDAGLINSDSILQGQNTVGLTSCVWTRTVKSSNGSAFSLGLCTCRGVQARREESIHRPKRCQLLRHSWRYFPLLLTGHELGPKMSGSPCGTCSAASFICFVLLL